MLNFSLKSNKISFFGSEFLSQMFCIIYRALRVCCSSNYFVLNTEKDPTLANFFMTVLQNMVLVPSSVACLELIFIWTESENTAAPSAKPLHK